MIKPGAIPQFTGDLGQLETDCADLNMQRIDLDDPEVDLDYAQRLLYRGELFTGEAEEYLAGHRVSLVTYTDGYRDGPSLLEQVGWLEDSLREPLAQYLDGSTVLMSAGNVADPLDADKGPIVPFGFSTDGQWAWPTYWAYFVREYGALVSHDFLEHARSRAFTRKRRKRQAISRNCCTGRRSAGGTSLPN